jgi:hypothetical protein
VTSRFTALLLCLGVMTFWLVAPAFGDSSGLTASSSVNATGTVSSVPLSSNLASSGPVLTSPEISISNANGSASASGSVQFGSISGAASGTGGSELVDAGEASFEGIWNDTLTVTSNTLAPDTTADLLFTMVFNFSTVCNGPNGTPYAEAEFEAGLQNATASNNEACNATSEGTLTLNLVTFVGATTAISGILNLDVTAGQGSSVQADPPVNFYIDSETVGASYTTASGTDYSTPVSSVPEPSTFGLLGFGLLGLIGLSLKKAAA